MLSLSEEQATFRDVIRRFLEDHSPEAVVRRDMVTDTGFDFGLWELMTRELGLAGVAIPEEHGGQGFGFVEQMVALEEMGRALVCTPYFSSCVLAANALLCSSDETAKKAHLPGIASGNTRATLALTEENGRWDEAGITMRATRSHDAWFLEGTKLYVLDGHTADVVLVAARSDEGVSLFSVAADVDELERTPLRTLDPTRKQARLDFRRVPATLIGVPGSGWRVVENVLDLAAVALAAEQIGSAQKCLEMSVGYASVRKQFGRSIGSFQAIKHRCADILLRVESARSVAYYAGFCAANGSAELAEMAPLAKSYCSEACLFAAAENIQIHGGIGFTWEHPAHLHFRRAKSSELLFGDPVHHRELLARRLGF